MLPPLQLQVAPGEALPDPEDAGTVTPAVDGARPNASGSPSRLVRSAPWILLAVALLAAFAWWRSRRRAPATGGVSAPPNVAAPPTPPSLAAALKQDDLAGIAHALCVEAGLRGDDLDAVRERLEDEAQREAVECLQAARWGDGDAASALAGLRRAFAKGARWRTPAAKPASLLPPLYPE
jgi:hypothetical protein